MISIIFSPTDIQTFDENNLLSEFIYLRKIFPTSEHNVNSREYLYVTYCCNLFNKLPTPSSLVLEYLGVALSLGANNKIIENIIWSLKRDDKDNIRNKLNIIDWIPTHYKNLLRVVASGANRNSVIRFCNGDRCTYVYYFGPNTPLYKNAFPEFEYDVTEESNLLIYLTTNANTKWSNPSNMNKYIKLWKEYGYINNDKMVHLVKTSNCAMVIDDIETDPKIKQLFENTNSNYSDDELIDIDNLFTKNHEVIVINDEDGTIYLKAHHMIRCWRYYDDSHKDTIDIVRLRQYCNPIKHTRFFDMLDTIKNTGSVVENINMLMYHLNSYETDIKRKLANQVIVYDDNQYIRHACLYILNNRSINYLTWFCGNGKAFFIDRFEAAQMFDNLDRYIKLGYNPIKGNEIIVDIIMLCSSMYSQKQTIPPNKANTYIKWCKMLGAKEIVFKKIADYIS